LRGALALAVLLGGCTLYEYQADDDTDPTFPDAGGKGRGPVGRTFFVDRVLSTSDNPDCPVFSQEALSHNVNVASTSTVLVDSMPATGVLVRATPATDGADPPNVTFTVREQWSSSEGPASPSVQYQMFVADDRFTGTATTFFQFSSPPTGTLGCGFSWTFEGFSG
jgi:hypothetical protein